MKRYAVKALAGDARVLGDAQVDVQSLGNLIVVQMQPGATYGDMDLVVGMMWKAVEGRGKNFLVLGANVRLVELEEVGG